MPQKPKNANYSMWCTINTTVRFVHTKISNGLKHRNPD